MPEFQTEREVTRNHTFLGWDGKSRVYESNDGSFLTYVGTFSEFKEGYFMSMPLHPNGQYARYWIVKQK